MITVYTDGSCFKNKKGGNASVFLQNNVILFCLIEKCEDTTNNREELKAVINTLEYLSDYEEKILVCSDSKYVIKGITEWIYSWEKKNYKNIKNSDLWKRLLTLKKSNCSFKKVKAHSGDRFNDLADRLAKYN